MYASNTALQSNLNQDSLAPQQAIVQVKINKGKKCLLKGQSAPWPFQRQSLDLIFHCAAARIAAAQRQRIRILHGASSALAYLHAAAGQELGPAHGRFTGSKVPPTSLAHL